MEVHNGNSEEIQMLDWKPLATPMIPNRQLIGYVMYIVNMKPNLCFAINTLCQVMVESKQMHYTVAKHLLQYLKGIGHYGLAYVGDSELILHGFIDYDWTTDASATKSTLGFCFSLGSGMIP